MKIPLQGKIFDKIIELADETQTEAYVIGGFVRDLLLKRKSPDIDIVVVGNGINFAKKLAKKIDPSIKVTIFKNFGTASFVYQNKQVELVGARKESYNRYSRNPIVEEGTLADDQLRRDFTINTLSISLNKTNLYEFIDPFGGLNDLKNRIIRTPQDPQITFSDDPLRMLRAIRFSTQLDFEIAENAIEAIKSNKERIKIVSPERISDELNKIIAAEKPSRGFKILLETGLLDIIFPELAVLNGVETINYISHKNIFTHSLKVLDNVAQMTDNIWIRWAALLHDIGKASTKKFIENKWTFHGHEFIGAKMIPAIFRRLRLPLNEKMKLVQKLISLHHRPIALVNEPITDSAIRRLIFDAGDNLEDLMILVNADITTKYEYKQKKFHENYKLLKEKIKEVQEKDFIRNWQPPLNGNDIINILGIPPSKTVGILKDKIKDAILDGKIENSYEAAYNLLVDLAKEMNLEIKKPLK